MKITITQLPACLERDPAKVWLVSGEEPLLMQEARDAIRQAAHRAGFDEYHRIATDSDDWINQLTTSLHSLSLFATRRFVEADLRTVRLTVAHTKALTGIVSSLPADVMLLLLAKRPDTKGTAPAWHLACETAGISLPIWPVGNRELPQWILQRARDKGLALSMASARWLAEQTEGNLLAAAQEIEKLSLWQDTGTEETNTDLSLREMITDNARYDIFQLGQIIKTGDASRALRVLSRLLLAGTEPALILWVIARECRARRDHPEWLVLAARIDRMIKGAEKGNVSDEMQALLLAMTGKSLPQTRKTVSRGFS